MPCEVRTPAASDGSEIEKSDPVTTDLGRELDKQILDIAIRRGEIENLRRYGWAEIEKELFYLPRLVVGVGESFRLSAIMPEKRTFLLAAFGRE